MTISKVSFPFSFPNRNYYDCLTFSAPNKFPLLCPSSFVHYNIIIRDFSKAPYTAILMLIILRYLMLCCNAHGIVDYLHILFLSVAYHSLPTDPTIQTITLQFSSISSCPSECVCVCVHVCVGGMCVYVYVCVYCFQ